MTRTIWSLDPSHSEIGFKKLKNRVVMAPMTRSRAIENISNTLMAEYYGQRKRAGLIITEGIAVFWTAQQIKFGPYSK